MVVVILAAPKPSTAAERLLKYGALDGQSSRIKQFWSTFMQIKKEQITAVTITLTKLEAEQLKHFIMCAEHPNACTFNYPVCQSLANQIAKGINERNTE
jgi:hypothetical protein